MSYCTSHTISIRACGVFGGGTDMADVSAKIQSVIDSMKDTPDEPRFRKLSKSLSGELWGNKGSMIVLAGVFNYWGFEEASVFALKLSAEFQTDVMIMSMDLEMATFESAAFCKGKPLSESPYQIIGRV